MKGSWVVYFVFSHSWVCVVFSFYRKEIVPFVTLLCFPFSGQNYLLFLCVHFWVKLFVTFSYFPAVAQPLSSTPIKVQLCGGTIRVNLTNKTTFFCWKYDPKMSNIRYSGPRLLVDSPSGLLDFVLRVLPSSGWLEDWFGFIGFAWLVWFGWLVSLALLD